MIGGHIDDEHGRFAGEANIRKHVQPSAIRQGDVAGSGFDEGMVQPLKKLGRDLVGVGRT